MELSNQKVADFESERPNAKKWKEKCYELEAKNTVLEKEKDVAIRDVRKMHAIIEVIDHFFF